MVAPLEVSAPATTTPSGLGIASSSCRRNNVRSKTTVTAGESSSAIVAVLAAAAATAVARPATNSSTAWSCLPLLRLPPARHLHVGNEQTRRECQHRRWSSIGRYWREGSNSFGFSSSSSSHFSSGVTSCRAVVAFGSFAALQLQHHRWRQDAAHGGGSSGSSMPPSRRSRGRRPKVALLAGTRESREAELVDLKLNDLKQICREKSLKVVGKKSELIDRILQEEEETTGYMCRTDDENADEDELTNNIVQNVVSQEDEDSARRADRTERFIQALEQDQVDKESLEEIFRIQRPQPGEIVKGQVSSVVEFGAFVELEDSGWTGLIHISEIADTFVETVEDYVKCGQTVECMVMKGGKDRLDRLALSLRRLHQPDGLELNSRFLSSSFPSSRAGGFGLVVGRRDPVADGFRRLEVRVAAIESVLLQLGHGKTLRSSQEDAKAGTNRPVVPPMEADVEVPNLTQELENNNLSVQDNEKQTITSILDNIMKQREAKGKSMKDAEPSWRDRYEDGDDSDDETRHPPVNAGFRAAASSLDDTMKERYF